LDGPISGRKESLNFRLGTTLGKIDWYTLISNTLISYTGARPERTLLPRMVDILVYLT